MCLGVVKALPHEGTRKVTNTPLEEDELAYRLAYKGVTNKGVLNKPFGM